jgi:phospholipase C
VTINGDPATISSGHSATLTVLAENAVQLTLTGSDGSTYSLPLAGGTQVVSPTSTTAYTATVTGAGGQQAQQATTITVVAPGTVDDVDHVVFMLQENHSFDNYFGMLNPYRESMKTNGVPWNVGADGTTYNVDGIDDKLTTLSNQNDSGTVYHPFKFTSTCIDDESSAWLESYGDVNRYDFLTSRSINMDGFVHTAEGFATSCKASGTCSGSFTDTNGQRAMGYYDQTYLNYYYYMASQFALSDRWFTPISSKSIDNRIATFTGGTTQGLTADPGNDDHLPQLNIPTIFGEMTQANASWKVYYTVTQGECLSEDTCPSTGNSRYPGTNFSPLQQSYTYLHEPSTTEQQTGCTPPTISSNNPITGDSTGSFCVDPTHIAPLSQFYVDISNGTLPDFSFIEAGYGNNDEHPGSGQSILAGQAQVSSILGKFMASPAWKDSVFFLAYDEDGGPFDHVPPVPGSSNKFTDASLGTIPDIGSIAVNPDSYLPCLPVTPPGTPTTHCDLTSDEPGANPGDAAASDNQGFAAQLGFRVPNMVISPFTRQHFVSHIPMDHTAVIHFVESRFIGSSAHLTARDAVQPDLLNFFDFVGSPMMTPPSPPTPYSDPNGATCTPANFAPTAP